MLAVQELAVQELVFQLLPECLSPQERVPHFPILPAGQKPNPPAHSHNRSSTIPQSDLLQAHQIAGIE